MNVTDSYCQPLSWTADGLLTRTGGDPPRLSSNQGSITRTLDTREVEKEKVPLRIEAKIKILLYNFGVTTHPVVFARNPPITTVHSSSLPEQPLVTVGCSLPLRFGSIIPPRHLYIVSTRHTVNQDSISTTTATAILTALSYIKS